MPTIPRAETTSSAYQTMFQMVKSHKMLQKNKNAWNGQMWLLWLHGGLSISGQSREALGTSPIKKKKK